MNWIKITVSVKSENVDMVCDAIFDSGIRGAEIDDPEDIEAVLQAPGWDYVDDEIMKRRGGEAKVSAYVPETASGRDTLNALKSNLNARFPGIVTELYTVREEDWESSWKKYFKPIEVSIRIAVKPRWETFKAKDGQIVVDIDPGMAFGTGTHETTRLCLILIEKYLKEGFKVLDIGCGSGILSIASVLLGASCAAGCDISEVAVKAALENAEHNGVSGKTAFFEGGLRSVKEGGFDLVCANIVADVLISISPDVKNHINRGGAYIVSGIIEERAQEVFDSIKRAGFVSSEVMTENGWCAAAFFCR